MRTVVVCSQARTASRLANAIQVAIERDEDVLDDVVDLVLAAEQPIREPRDLSRVRAEELGEPLPKLGGVRSLPRRGAGGEGISRRRFHGESEQSRRATATAAIDRAGTRVMRARAQVQLGG